jgi:hypothetical protein
MSQIWGFILGIVIGVAVSVYVSIRIYQNKKLVFIQIFVANLFTIAYSVIVFYSDVTGYNKSQLNSVGTLGLTFYGYVVIQRWWVFTGQKRKIARIILHILNGGFGLAYSLASIVFPSRTSITTPTSAVFNLTNCFINYGVNAYIIYRSRRVNKNLSEQNSKAKTEKSGYFMLLYIILIISFSTVVCAVAMGNLKSQNPFIQDVVSNVTALFNPVRFLCEVIFQFAIQRIFDRKRNLGSTTNQRATVKKSIVSSKVVHQ